MLEIDHVILVVSDLESAGRNLLDGWGLASLAGGRHPGLGTGNRIVPLGRAYLEVLAVVDEAEAAGNPFGRWALAQRREGLAPAALCLRTEAIDPVARLLDESPASGSRVRDDGVTLAWRTAGLDGMLGPRHLPFFIEWEIDPGDHPGAAIAPHRAAPSGIAAVAIGPVTSPLAGLLGRVPGLTITDGARGVHAVTIATAAGEVVFPS